MKKIGQAAKKKIIVALLGMCVVASTYTAHAVLPQGQTSASTTTVQSDRATPPQDVWSPPVSPAYNGYYGYYGYTYSSPYAYYNTYYYGAGGYYYGGASSVSGSDSWAW